MDSKTSLEIKIENVAKEQYPNDLIPRKALEFGAWWFYNEAIEKAYEFVVNNINKYIGYCGDLNKKDFKKDFEEYMRK